jgi:di/tricarboxylate transporter
MSLSQYKDTFGKVGEGIHSYRISNVAVVDLGLTAVTSYAIAKSFDWNFLTTFLGTLALGETAHYAIGVETSFMKMLGIKFEHSESEESCHKEEKKCPFH